MCAGSRSAGAPHSSWTLGFRPSSVKATEPSGEAFLRKSHTEGMRAMVDISRAFEWIAVAVLIVAFSLAVLGCARDLLRGVAASSIYRRGRAIFGRGLLISLEALVAADLIRTVAVHPTIKNVGVLGMVVAVRTLLVFALDVEIDGVLPLRKRELGAIDRE
jgi:uncharacterized membrane protein